MTVWDRLGLSMDLAPTSRCPWLSPTLTAAAPAHVSSGATTTGTQGLHEPTNPRQLQASALCPPRLALSMAYSLHPKGPRTPWPLHWAEQFLDR